MESEEPEAALLRRELANFGPEDMWRITSSPWLLDFVRDLLDQAPGNRVRLSLRGLRQKIKGALGIRQGEKLTDQ